MTFARNLLTRMSSNYEGPKLWGYVNTADAQADVNTAGYFNLAANDLEVGDLIYARLSDGNFWFPVNANNGTTVDVANGDALTATDSD
jgi:hypothetical protein